MKKKFLSAALFSLLNLSVSAASSDPLIDVGFSPEGSAQQLVLRTLDDAHESIRLMGYSFTSPEIVKSLVAARQRGIDVRVVVDDKGKRSKASQAAMNVMVYAGIQLRTNGQYKIMHDKVIITDGQNVELGLFDYTRSAAKYNSENALVVRGVPPLAQAYLTHWPSGWEEGGQYI